MFSTVRILTAKSAGLKGFCKNAMPVKMSLSFLCSDRTGSRFITSDDPVTLFNPDLQWQRFYGPGLAQRNIQVTMSVSPNITA